ncbi:hypothetical protein ABVK25_006919 [Lepraria finkii]|uniref:Uncharacterized protein n=1 Tax=Lepraria finkii TaxID=1340010 RepID=A0ABR4B491_9LECA
MKTILEQSAVVYAWLGLPTEDTSMAFEKLEEFSKVVAGRLFHQFLDERCVGGGVKEPLLGVRDQTAFEAARLLLSSVIEIQDLTETFILWGERVSHPPF